MLDINLFRESPDVVRQNLAKRHMDPGIVDQILEIDAERRALLTQVEALKADRNSVSKEIGKSKDQAERQAKIEAMRLVGDQITNLDERIRQVDEALNAAVSAIPNLLRAEVPEGKDESENVVVRVVGQIPEFDFTPVPHWDLGTKLGILNFEQGVKITGSRFYVLSGAGARLQRALIAWILDLHIRQGYREQNIPYRCVFLK